MAHDKAKIFEKAKEVIVKHNLFFVEDVVAFLPCSKFYYYDAFPVDSNEYNQLRELLEANKVRTKTSIRAKLFRSEKAAELLALYRLICTSEEHQKLNQQYIDHSNKDGSLKPTPDLTKLTEDELRTIAELQRKSGIS